MHDIDLLRRQIQDLAPIPQERRYPPELRQKLRDVAKHLGKSKGVVAIAKQLGMAPKTLQRFIDEQPQTAEPVPFRSVVLKQQPEQTTTSDKPVLRAPGGIVVEGLTLQQIAELIRELSP